MNKGAVLNKTINNLNKLSEKRLIQVSEFVEFFLQKNAAESEAFNFLKEEEELYNDDDLAERF